MKLSIGYGDHQLDQLYSDFDRTGSDTPAPLASGSATPLSPQSRSTSVENLASMDNNASSGMTATALQNRLNALRIRDESMIPATGDDSSQVRSQSARNSPIRRTSDEDESPPTGLQTPLGPLHIEFSEQDLARVPSYATALGSRSNVPVDITLPTYQSAVRNPEAPTTTPTGNRSASSARQKK